jgi:hypothetical protein
VALKLAGVETTTMKTAVAEVAEVGVEADAVIMTMMMTVIP